MDHLPFAYDLVEAIRPRLLVELGTYSGLSFFAFCQAIKEHKVEGVAYAVDTWVGDEHTGEYGEEVYRKVEQHARDNYSGFSYLLKMRFDQAVNQFDDDSIDLLHIDGLHTYEAVKEDFDTWYPKVKPGGIVLMHDIEARLPDFGVRKLWEELTSSHQTFAFVHGFGLGVLKKSGGDRQLSELESLLFSGNSETEKRLRDLYVHISHHHHVLRELKKFKKQVASESG